MWKTVSTADREQVASWWQTWPDAEIGVPMPEGTVAIDIDNLKAVQLAEQRGELQFRPTPGQQTRSGGFHFFYRTDGRPVPQVVKRGGVELDTRVGGKGYVICYDEAAFHTEEWADAPEWVYATAEEEHAEPREGGAPMGTRNDILSWLGTFAARGIALSERQYLTLLREKAREGEIIALDPDRPWTDKDFAVLASEAAKWEVGKVLLPPLLKGEDAVLKQGLAGMDAADLLRMDIPPLQWAFQGLLQEGMVVIAAPPKVGKSLLAYQMAVHLVMGLDLLGCAATKRPVRYYALEDGQRRSQARILGVLRAIGTNIIARGLDLRWTAPTLGGGLEAECGEYLQANPGGVIIIDVLSKVRPPHMGGKSLNAYDEDYKLLEQLHDVTRRNVGSSIVVITHDRKAGAEDWVSRVTGTRGITGVADEVIYIDRKRMENMGTIKVTGRDAADLTLSVAFAGDGWQLADANALIEGMSPTRQLIYNYVAANGPAMQKDISEGTGIKHENVLTQVSRMTKDGQLQAGPGGYTVVPLGDER